MQLIHVARARGSAVLGVLKAEKSAQRIGAFVIQAFACLVLAGAAPTSDPLTVPVSLSGGLGRHQSGRLIVFVERAAPDTKQSAVDFDRHSPDKTAIAAREISDLSPGDTVRVKGDMAAFPVPFSTLPAGQYRVQAVLDRNHDYTYAGRGAGDLASTVLTVSLPGPVPTIVLDHVIATEVEPDEPDLMPLIANIRPINFRSPSLTAFFGKPTAIRGWVALPPGYDGKRRFPTVFWNNGFGGTLAEARTQSLYRAGGMKFGAIPPMIWVQLDQSSSTGAHEFADSANNGPWGHALISELIPALERTYAMDAQTGGRFLTGHSSGGWSALWLQIRYPKVFGGAWATAPDPTDFHDASNVNIYAHNANYYRSDGARPLPLMRENGKVVMTTEQFARSEAVLGPSGGQLASFEWVFSPRGNNGRPMPLFDRATGRIDPTVAAYWRDHYDLAHIVERDAERLRPALAGKVHLFVGTDDNYYLDQSAHLLEAAMRRARIPAECTFVAGRDHHDLFTRGPDQSALFKDIAWAMYAVARPKAKRPR